MGAESFIRHFKCLISIKLNICRANNVQNSVKGTKTTFAHMCIMSHHNCHLVDSLILELFKCEKCISWDRWNMVAALLPKYPSYSFMLFCLLKTWLQSSSYGALMILDPIDIPTMHMCSSMSLWFCSGLFRNKFLWTRLKESTLILFSSELGWCSIEKLEQNKKQWASKCPVWWVI